MQFEEYAEIVEKMPWPGADGDKVARDALTALLSGKSALQYGREARIDDLAALLWYVATRARMEGVAFTSVADRSIAALSVLPKQTPYGP